MKSIFAVISFTILTAGSAAGQYALQFGASVAVDGDQIMVAEGRNLLQPGKVFIYSFGDDTWNETASLSASDPGDDGDGFGRAMSAFDGTLVVGAPQKGSAYIFEYDGGLWTEKNILSEDNQGFGGAVSVSGDHLAVGAAVPRGGSGKVHMYRRSEDSDWDYAGSLSGTGENDGFGSVVVVQNNNLAIAAPTANGRTGAVYTYQYSQEKGRWELSDSLQFRGLDERDSFGSALYLAGDHLIVGAPGYENGVGAVAVYRLMDGTWEFEKRLSPFDARGGEQFGASLAFAHGSLLVGAPGYDARSGNVYVFETSMETGRMSGVQQIAPANLEFRSSYGTSLAANDAVAAIGAVGHDNFEGGAFLVNGEMWADAELVVNNTGEFASLVGEEVKCEDGAAASFGCSDVDMLSFLAREDVGADRGIQMSDVWGWTDPQTGSEYAIVGRTDGTSFIDLSDPYNPVYLGDLPKTATANQSLWRDIKVYRDHAFIVADGAGAHHLQIFDLKQLRGLTDLPKQFEETAIYKGVYSSHNIAINEETGFAYAVGSDSGGETCGGALHMIDVRDPANPKFAGCFNDPRTGRNGSGATHDTQCVTYRGPDSRYTGREICLSSNGTALSIADVTDKENPVAISIAEYPNVAYTHQGWLTEDHRYFYLNDEGDEVSGLVDATRTVIFDLTELDDPTVAGEYKADNNAIDHNLYVKGDLMYQANYSAGLRIIDIKDPVNPKEVAFFDTVPYGKNDNSPVLGAWSTYPYFESGVIVVTSGREGVFFLKKKEVEL
ncbi:MAG: choice-of-anchor B family protein [Rhodothermales bacterium]|nr:choice-of-anchor B family protein [Rhodothermales bacterium]